MKTFISKSLCIGFLFCIHSLQAQVPEQWSWSLQLLGNWKGPASLTIGDQTFFVTYYAHFKSTTSGSGMTMDEYFNDPDLGNFKGSNLIGLNAFDGLIHWSSVDNMGIAHEHLGSWSDSKHFHMEHHISGGGQTYDELLDFTLNANNTQLTVLFIVIMNGETIETNEGTLTRSNGNNNGVNNAPLEVKSDSALKIFPNPSSGNIEISGERNMDEILVTDEAGRIVYQVYPKSTHQQIHLERPGTFSVRVRMGEEVITRQVYVFIP